MCVNKSSLIFQSNYRTSITSESKNSSLPVFVGSFFYSFSSFQFNSVPWIFFDLRFIYYISTKEFEKILITIEWNWWLIHYFLFLSCCARSCFSFSSISRSILLAMMRAILKNKNERGKAQKEHETRETNVQTQVRR